MFCLALLAPAEQKLWQGKLIILFRKMYLVIGMDRMQKLLREYISQTGFAVCCVSSPASHPTLLYYFTSLSPFSAVSIHPLATRLCCIPARACQPTLLFCFTGLPTNSAVLLHKVLKPLCCISSPAIHAAFLYSLLTSELLPYSAGFLYLFVTSSAVFLHLSVTLLCCTPSKACLPSVLYCIPSPFQSFATFSTPFFLVTDYLLHSILCSFPSPTSHHIVRSFHHQLFPYTLLY